MLNLIARLPAMRLFIAAALVTIPIVLLGAASASSSPERRAGTVRWDGRSFQTTASIAFYLSSQGVDTERFLRTHPVVVDALGFAGVRWDGQTFYTAQGIRRWHVRTGTSVTRWLRSHRAAARALTLNASPQRQTSAFKRCRDGVCGAPLPTAPPLVRGRAAVGQAVTVSSGSWSDASALRYSYRWQRCDSRSCANISDASSQTYSIRNADLNTSVRAIVRATNPAGSASATSNLVGPVTLRDPVPSGRGGSGSSGSGATPPAAPAPTPAPAAKPIPTPTPAPTLTTAPTTAPTPAPAPPPAPVSTPSASTNRFGIAAGGTIEWANETDLAQELDGYAQMGAGWIRFDIKWSTVEANRGTFTWTIYDRLVGEARKRGLSIIGNLAYTPTWARPAGATDNKFAPASVADYANFARAAVAHFAPLGVSAYEIWNEPNHPGFWKPAPDPVKYTALLRAAYTAMKSADSSAVVLAGAFSPAGGYDDPSCGGGPTANINALNFLETMYANGAKGHFDALSHHPYAGSAGPESTHRCSAWYQMFGTSPSLRSVLTSNGDSAMKIWGTEFGTDVAWVGGSEAQQAAQIGEAMRRWREFDWTAGLMVYSYKQDLEGFNLVRADWTKRPAWHTYQSAPKS